MGNILCFPKQHKKSDPKDRKKQRKRSSKKNRRVRDPQNDESGGTFDIEDAQPSNDSVDQTDPQIRCSRSPEVYVCPVVSSSILLRHGYEEEEDSDRKLSKDHGENEQVDPTTQSVDIEARSTVTDDTASKLNLKIEETMVATVKRLSEEITPTTKEMSRQEEPVSTVRVINVQEVNDSLSPVLTHLETYTEAPVASTREVIRDGEQVASNNSIELEEANKRSGSNITSTNPDGLFSDVQKNIENPSGTETKQDLFCLMTVEGKMKEIRGDITSEQVIEDIEKNNRSRFSMEKIDEPTTKDVDDKRTECGIDISKQILESRKLRGVQMVDSNKTIDRSKHIPEEKCRLDVKNLTNICTKFTDEVSTKPREYPKDTTSLRQGTSISNPVVAKMVTENKALPGIADVETPIRENTIKGTGSKPVVSEKRHVSSHMKEFGALLNVLSTLQIPAEKTKSDPVVPASDTKRHIFGPQSDSSDKLGVYKSKQGIETWIKKSSPETSSPSRKDNNTPIPSTSAKKVSDFLVPWKPRKLPQKPLSLKKPSSHLYKIPDIAKSNSEDDDKVNWTQVEPKGPQTEVLWTTKPSAFDVKLPPLPKRLLERKGSVEKLQEMWIIPQVKQIETLKREYGRFPGLVVPTALRKNYSVDIKKEVVTDDVDDNSGVDTHKNNNDLDCNPEMDTALKRDN